MKAIHDLVQSSAWVIPRSFPSLPQFVPIKQLTELRIRHGSFGVGWDKVSQKFSAGISHFDLLRHVMTPIQNAYPTLPSKLTPKSFCASTANSIGSSRKTSLQKPLTIMLTASSAEMPRCWK